MIDEKEPTEMEYGFKINNKDGFYYIKFDDEIIEEKIYYMMGKQRGIVERKDLVEIKKYENVLNIFFTQNFCVFTLGFL